MKIILQEFVLLFGNRSENFYGETQLAFDKTDSKKLYIIEKTFLIFVINNFSYIDQGLKVLHLHADHSNTYYFVLFLVTWIKRLYPEIGLVGPTLFCF